MTPDDARPEPEIDPISARYVWGPEVLTEGYWAHSRHQVRPAFRFLLNAVVTVILLLGVAIVAAWASRPKDPARPEPFAVFLGLFITFFFAFLLVALNSRLFLRMKARAVFRSAPASGGMVDWIFGPDEIEVRSPVSSSLILWPVYIKVVESPGGFLFYQQPALFQWVPAHAFRSAGEIARLIALARSRVPRYLVAGPCRFAGKPESDGRYEL